MEDLDLTGRRTTREGMRLRAMYVIAVILAVLFCIAIACAPVEEAHDQEPAARRSAAAAPGLRLSPEEDRRAPARASRARPSPSRTHDVPRRVAQRSRADGQGAREVPRGFEEWRTSRAAQAVARCESGGDPRAVSRTGKYRGKWQMDADFWRTYGGLAMARRPDLAGEREQDLVAYRGWLDRGWQPWECRKVL